MWECGLKRVGRQELHFDKVTPHVGVWIETVNSVTLFRAYVSLPMWECGLKLPLAAMAELSRVTPHVGVWIETGFLRWVLYI